MKYIIFVLLLLLLPTAISKEGDIYIKTGSGDYMPPMLMTHIPDAYLSEFGGSILLTSNQNIDSCFDIIVNKIRFDIWVRHNLTNVNFSKILEWKGITKLRSTVVYDINYCEGKK
jgi:hypothetical protein